MTTYLFTIPLLLIVALMSGCTSYTITSTPPGAKIEFKSPHDLTAWNPRPSRTPSSVRKGKEWPYGFTQVAVRWDDGTHSEWVALDEDIHFTKKTARRKHMRTASAYEDLPIVSYQFDSARKRGTITIDIQGQGIEARHWAVENIGEICSDKNITMIAGQESHTGGAYQVLNESVKDGLLTIEFSALY